MGDGSLAGLNQKNSSAKLITKVIAEIDEHAEIIERADRFPPFVSPAEVENEAAGRLQDTVSCSAETAEPGNIIGLFLIAVCFLPQQARTEGSS